MFNILLVDDIETNLIALELLLESNFEELKISKVLSAYDAFEIIQNEKIDLIISDIQMPEMNGFTFLEALKQDEKTKEIPVIFITSIFDTNKYKEKAFSLGILDYITKPIEPTIFILKIKNYIDIYKLQKEVNSLNKRLEAIFNSQESIVVISNNKGTVNINQKFFNDFAFKNFEEFKSKHNCISELFISKNNVETLKPEIDNLNWIDYINKNSDLVHEVYMIDKEGNEKIYEVKSSGKFLSKNENEEEIIVFNDITKLKTQHYLLTSQSRFAAMGEMISMIAHQWRQPLTSLNILNYKLLIFKDMDMLTPESIQEIYEKNKNLITYLSDTIDDFMNFFKSDENKLEDISFNKLIAKTTSLFETELVGNNIKLHILIDKEVEDTSIKINSSKITQVLMNLIKNAKDAIMEKNLEEKFINVRVFKDDYLNISIEDNAGGIPDDIIDKIFEPYFSTKSKNGTGLGLYMSKIIIEEQLKGKLLVQNSDNGATFTIKLDKTFEI